MTTRSLAAAVLAVPVLATVYLRAAVRPRVVAGGIVVAALVVSSVQPSPSVATSGTTPSRPAAAAFEPVVVEGDTGSPTGPLLGTAVVHPPPRDRSGETAMVARMAALPAPAVVRFRPRDGTRGVAAPLEVSVRFTEPMDRAVTTPAFSIVVAGKTWSGKARWAERGTVLVVRFARRLPAGAKVRLVVSEAARSAAGRAIATEVKATFRIARPSPKPTRAASTSKPTTSARSTASGWSWPLIGPITQRFGESLTKYGYHQGIDIDGNTGDRVRAARAGRVTLAGKGDSCGGIQVRIDHGGGIETWYRHLSAVSVSKGQLVDRRQVVGRVGSTGCSYGSHLHFAVRRHGDFVDPLTYLPPR